jgi:hypothetical protein
MNIVKQMANVSLSSNPRQREDLTGGSAYFKTLMYPELFSAKLPRRPVGSLLIRRKVSFNLVTGALGALGVAWNPWSLCDTTNNNTTLFSVNNATYDGITTMGTPASATALAFPTQITANTALEYRVISASLQVVPQIAALSQAGSIHGGVIRLTGVTPQAIGATTANYNTVLLAPNIQNDKTYNVASATAMQGLRVVWYPIDENAFELLRINTNYNSVDANNSPNQLVAIVTGASAAAPFRIDCYINYEVTPAPNSSYQGLETLIDDPTDPLLVLNDVVCHHYKNLVTAIPAGTVNQALASLIQGEGTYNSSRSSNELQNLLATFMGGKRFPC